MWAFAEKNVFKKIEMVRRFDLNMINLFEGATPDIPERDVSILVPKHLPPKKGFASPEGQARMLHDLASIELQAMELGLRTLADFPQAPDDFKEKLFAITLSECDHLEMCLTEIDKLGFKWGDWPVHTALWSATSIRDSLLDRILIVHRYLEGSGLDAGDTLLRRLTAVEVPSIKFALKRIGAEEIEHVLFGSDWYREICRLENIDPNQDYFSRMTNLRGILPKRIEPINKELRKKSGFSDLEIEFLENLRLSFLDKNNPWKK
ncbi:MAG: DUF455 family protein [Pseudobdellovibrio sp.]